MKNYRLLQFAFDGYYVTDSEHETIEDARETSEDLGSKWFFYPLTVIASGQTVKETGGAFYNTQTGACLLSEKLKGKRVKTVCKILSEASKKPELIGCEWDEFESYLLETL
jgi:hypothetical protein